MATYTGPTVSPVFVAGVINDAWAKATELTTQPAASVDGLSPVPIESVGLTPLEAPDDFTVTLPSIQSPVAGAADSLEDELTDLLRNFIGDNYPAVATPDGAAAWARVAATFDGGKLALIGQDVRARVDSVWDVRGFTMPAEAREFQLRAHDREAALVAAGSVRNNEIILKTHRKAIDLTQFEMVMRTQLEALEAARAFLLGCVLAILAKQKDEQVTLARFKEEMQQAFWRHLQARIEANSVELDRLILAKKITLDAGLSEEDNRVFAFRQLVQVALDECQSVASQASAAINRVSASAGVSGSERTP